MKKISSLLTLLIVFCGPLCAQDIWEGAWHGKIEMANLRLVFNIKSLHDGSISATMDSPDQSAFGLPVESASVSGDSIFIKDAKFRLSFSGKRTNDSTIQGVFTQGMDIPMVLTRTTAETSASKNPVKTQTPVPPFPYREEEVIFENKKAGVRLSGTLTIPAEANGNGYPAVVLISGSGPQDRDETLFGHKPFAVIADHLTRRGMMVLRYDDRGTGKSTGNFSNSTSADFADDAAAAVQFVTARPEADKNSIGLIGHSEGGLIAPVVANENKDVDYIVLLAGPGVPIRTLMAEQNVAIMKSQGIDVRAAEEYGKLYNEVIEVVSKKLTANEKEKEIIKIAGEWERNQPQELLKLLGLGEENWQQKFAQEMIKETSGNWMQYFLNYDPKQALQNLKVKVLALNGDKDNQVVAKSNLAAIETALKKSKSPSFEISSLPGLNHLFQTCKFCTVAEYAGLEETFSPTALKAITKWLEKEGFLK